MIGFNQINIKQVNNFQKLAIRELVTGYLLLYVKGLVYKIIAKGK